MIEGVPRTHSKTEQPKPLMDIEGLHVFGNQYKSLLAHITGATTMPVSDIEALPQQLRKLFEIAEAYRDTNEKLVQQTGINPRTLLAQAFPSQEHVLLLEDASKYRVQKLSKGIYAVFVDRELSHKLRPGIAAMAYRGKNKAQFIYIQNYSDPEYQKRNLAENIPHETHHLIWGVAREHDIFPNTETDEHFHVSFRTFQEELVARASTSGGLAGYHHIFSLSPEQREQLEHEMPGHADAIIKRVSDLNGFLHDLRYLLHESVALSSLDLIQPLMSASSFDELEENLKKFKELVEASPRKEKGDDSGGIFV